MDNDKRLDALVTAARGFPRGYAAEVIARGLVTVNGKPVVKPGAKIPAGADIAVNADPPRYVSRGGEKLAHALAAFGLDVSGKRCLDVGASTGGFTDCLLQHGASHVTALDVGRGQLAGKLRADPRVAVYEQTDIRGFQAEAYGLAAADLSFISLAKALPDIWRLIEPGGAAVALVKPQFEAGRAALNRKGIVVNPKDRAKAVANVAEAARALGFDIIGSAPSPIAGGDGNIEHLLLLRRGAWP